MNELLSSAERARLARMALRPRRRLSTQAPGSWRSGRLGHGLLFAEHRPYVAGDDPRYVDWHVAARLGELAVKLFESEEDLDLVLLVDRSASMRGRKSLLARRLAAALAHLALDHQDRVRIDWLPPLADRLPPPARGPGALTRLLARLRDVPDAGAARLAVDAARWLRGRERKAWIVVVSDCHDAGDPLRALRRLRALGHDVLVVHVQDAADVELPLGVPVRAQDAETGELVDVDVTPEVQRLLTVAWRRRQLAFARACVQAGLAHVAVEAQGTLWDALQRLSLSGHVGRG
jgi:uncharacterized protein (DUF58 family)